MTILLENSSETTSQHGYIDFRNGAIDHRNQSIATDPQVDYKPHWQLHVKSSMAKREFYKIVVQRVLKSR
ncbi:hypothetical protein SCLCIDRAFT_1122324 [Scleroderma citrinum Foug A]|uniref:Uncharacterized protein n=1 Tax=Scleroderma citrinum Foug A TaxID=1036808 RepID=A0A0C2Z6T4_9AGAM|nr:hypothetical protein SCLCIDRAFT_1122324 [Scleroderma citrinum Foug A]